MLPALPLIAVGVAAAAAGWLGAHWWRRLQSPAEAEDENDAGRSAHGPPSDAQSLVWCPACRTYFVAGEGLACEAPDCPQGYARHGA